MNPFFAVLLSIATLQAVLFVGNYVLVKIITHTMKQEILAIPEDDLEQGMRRFVAQSRLAQFAFGWHCITHLYSLPLYILQALIEQQGDNDEY